MQYFKGDNTEKKFVESARPFVNQVSTARNDFLNGAYDCVPLGQMIWDSKRSPLSNAITRNIFSEAFSEIFDAFVNVGTFESYIVVFQKIFGETVDVTFTVPGPGQLNIDIIADGVELSNFVSRSIVEETYVFDEIIDYDDDNIVFQTVKGFQTQYELEQMLFEMVPGGIYTQISLTLGA